LEKIKPHHDAGAVATTTPIPPEPEDASLVSDDDDEEIDAGAAHDAAAPCPRAIHPGYCRRRCKSFAERKRYPHARRVYLSAVHALGTCDSYDVFAEKQADGGGIIEFYDKSGNLVGAQDTRQECGIYGTIPTCNPTLAWTDASALSGLKKF
jgi:hypothetical protein